jgi:hypothetical protein
MKWMKERDLLIAQTMAFVQSVTGKRPDAELLSAAPPPSTQFVALSEAPPPAAAVAQPSGAAPAPALMPAPTVVEVPPASVPTPPAAAVVQAAPAQPPRFVKLDIRGDFQSEVRARVENFRANQQRFLREREEYCSSTMAKVRAAIRDNSELPRSGK